jgi:hypothetical protein
MNRRAIRALTPALVPELTELERINRLRDELRLLEPYRSTDGLVKLRDRCKELNDAINRLTGLPLDEPGRKEAMRKRLR